MEEETQEPVELSEWATPIVTALKSDKKSLESVVISG